MRTAMMLLILQVMASNDVKKNACRQPTHFGGSGETDVKTYHCTYFPDFNPPTLKILENVFGKFLKR
jgi:hypothetical protein